jgi:DNA-binding MarR family transcriptional regulator
MADFVEIAKVFNNLALKVSKRNGLKHKNGLYLRTVMVFMAYASLPGKECNAQNAKSYLLNILNFDANVATISRNTSVLRDLGLITSVEDPKDARVKMISFTTLGKEFAKLMR